MTTDAAKVGREIDRYKLVDEVLDTFLKIYLELRRAEKVPQDPCIGQALQLTRIHYVRETRKRVKGGII